MPLLAPTYIKIYVHNAIKKCVGKYVHTVIEEKMFHAEVHLRQLKKKKFNTNNFIAFITNEHTCTCMYLSYKERVQ